MPNPDVTGRIAAAFGTPGFPDATFYKFEDALRFELGAGVYEPVPRFLQVLDRARAVAREAFRVSPSLTAIVSYHAWGQRMPRVAAGLKTLDFMGFTESLGKPERVFLEAFTDERGRTIKSFRYWHMAEFANEAGKVDALLWAGAAREMSIEPTARWLSYIYLVDFERRLALNLYDDRGMDVFAMSTEVLQPLYDAFGDWLLDYDRARMDARFAKQRG